MERPISPAQPAVPEENLRGRIFRLRGHQVMLDEDLAALYGVAVKALNQAVRRNLERFPPEFMFQLTPIEHQAIRSQSVTASRRNVRYRPLAFTEHGIAMLSSVLKSDRAIRVNIAIIKTFIQLRRAVLANRDLNRRIERVEGRLHLAETDIRFLREDMRSLKSRPPEPERRVKGFEGWK